jgi:hypothetical protein
MQLDSLSQAEANPAYCPDTVRDFIKHETGFRTLHDLVDAFQKQQRELELFETALADALAKINELSGVY